MSDVSPSELIEVNVTVADASVTKAGFGTILIVAGAGTGGSSVVASYSKLTEVAADYATNATAYLAAQAVFSQNPRPKTVKIAKRASDATVADVLNAVAAVDNDWYGVILGSRVTADITAAAAWVESHGPRLLMVQSADSGIIASGSSDVASTLQSSAYARTGLLYHPTAGQYGDAAWLAKLLTVDPDFSTTTGAYKTLTGVTVTDLTSAQSGYALGKNANTYQRMAGSNRTRPGMLASGRFMDVAITIDWTQLRLEEALLQLLCAKSDAGTKLAYDDFGLEEVKAVIEGVMARGVRAGHFVAGSVVVEMPALADISSDDKADRVLTGIEVTAQLSGAIHTIASFNVTLSV